MGAIIDLIQPGVIRPKGLLHLGVDIFEGVLFDEPSSHTGLIGHDNCDETGQVQLPDSCKAVGVDFDGIIGTGISDIFVECPISVKKNGSLCHGFSVRQAWMTSSGVICVMH